ncbi:MAG: hypothetical protein M9921_09925 [Fimbriimonadaceae bacterium]|nr:hypothetical protein [Fimbriimonadaceae bacterium]
MTSHTASGPLARAKRLLSGVEGLLAVGPETLGSFTLRRLVAILVVFGAFYGAVMGSFGGDAGPRVQQMLYSALKVPLLLGVTFALSVPTFFVTMTLMGLRNDFAVCLRALMATQAALAIVLASFAPLTLLWYASSADYSGSLLLNAAMFGVASLSVQQVLRRLYRPLIRRDPRHRAMMRAWLGIFAFVGIQMGWVLRPFIGNPAEPTTFFRHEAWGNAYEMVARHVMTSLGL